MEKDKIDRSGGNRSCFFVENHLWTKVHGWCILLHIVELLEVCGT